MASLRRLAQLWPLVVALAACSPPAPAPAPTPPAGAPPAAAPGASAPATVPAPAAPLPPPAASAPVADAERDAVLFTHWRAKHVAEVDAFEEFLVREQVAAVVPTYQLLRSASMWKECHAE